MQLDEDAVRDALEGLQQQRMAAPRAEPIAA